MADDAKSVVENIHTAWKSRDLDRVLNLLADDMVFALHIPREVLPIGGETKGKTAVTAALRGLLDTYDFVTYDPGPLSVDGGKVSGEVKFQYREKATGEAITNQLRQLWLVDAGKAQRLDEWHDLAAVTSFLDRVSLRLASKASEGSA